MNWAYQPGVFYRVDDPRTASSTVRQLRSGRPVDMAVHRGLIYKDTFFHLREVELHVEIFDKTKVAGHSIVWSIENTRRVLLSLVYTIMDCSSPDMSAVRPPNTNWSIVLNSLGKIGHGCLRNAVQPLLTSVIVEAVRQGSLEIYLRGQFPRKWESIFKRLMGPKFFAGDVALIEDESGLDPAGLADQLGYVEEIDDDDNDAMQDHDNDNDGNDVSEY